MQKRAGQVVDRVQRAEAGDQAEAGKGQGSLLVQPVFRRGFSDAAALRGQRPGEASAPVADHQRGFGRVAQEGEAIEHVLDHVVEQVARRIRLSLERAHPAARGKPALA